MNEVIALDSGYIEKLTFPCNENTVNHIISAIQAAKPDFKDSMYMICFAHPADGRDIGDVIDDYLEVCNTGITFATPDTMATFNLYTDTMADGFSETKRTMYIIERTLLSKHFIKIVFNRSLNTDNRASIVFVYDNEDGRRFIEEYKSFIDRTETV